MIPSLQMALALFLMIYNLCNWTSSRHELTSQRNTSTKEISQDPRTSRRLFTQFTQIGQNDIAAGFRTLSNEQFKAVIPDVIESHISYSYMVWVWFQRVNGRILKGIATSLKIKNKKNKKKVMNYTHTQSTLNA